MAEPIEQLLEMADVYAEALFGLARDAGAVPDVRNELEELVKLQKQEPAFAAFLRSDAVDADRRQVALERMFQDRLSDLVLNTLLVMNRHGRAGLLDALLRRFVARNEEEAGEIEVVATSAVALDEPRRQEVEQLAARLSGKRPLVQYVVDAGLIAGLVLTIADLRLDYSVRRQLHVLHEQLEARASRGLGVKVE